jgi:2-polyprenyl-6-methoxyphenol hydroxylase-like FAD-dependent oxidoreductase
MQIIILRRLMAANWMSRLGIKARIVDKRADALSAGQADAVQPRTLEIWDSFGIADGILKEATPMSGSNSSSMRSQISILKNLRRILLLESR